MGRLRHCLGFIAAAMLPVQSLAADSMTTSVNTHMNAISWLTGTYQCTSHTVYSNGKSRTGKSTVTGKLQAGWVRLVVSGQPGSSYYGYDPKKNKYVSIAVNGPGAYGAGYFDVASDRSISLELPDAIDNDVYSSGDYTKVTPTSTGFDGTTSGPSDRYPGLHGKTSFTCVRQ